MSTKVLLTGAAGFIGSHFAEALLARGYQVTGVDNFDPFYARAVKERNLEGVSKHTSFEFVEADVARDPLPLDGVEAIVHLAAKPGVRPSLEDPGAYMEANVTATARVFAPSMVLSRRKKEAHTATHSVSVPHSQPPTGFGPQLAS